MYKFSGAKIAKIEAIVNLCELIHIEKISTPYIYFELSSIKELNSKNKWDVFLSVKWCYCGDNEPLKGAIVNLLAR